MKTARGGVNEPSTSAPVEPGERTVVRGARRTGGDARSRDGDVVADLLYAVVVIVVFAMLLFAVRGLDRL